MGEYRFILVVALLGVAGSLLTDRSKMPLPLRSLQRIMRRTVSASGSDASAVHRVSRVRRLAAFACVLAAFAVAAWG